MRSRNGSRPVQISCQLIVKNLIDQRALSGAGNAGHKAQNAQRNLHINVLQIVHGCAAHRKPSGRLTSHRRDRNIPFSRQILAGKGIRIAHDLFRSSASDHLTSV